MLLFTLGCRKDCLVPLLVKFLEEAVGKRRRSGMEEMDNQEKPVDQMRVHAASLIGRLCYDLKGTEMVSYQLICVY